MEHMLLHWDDIMACLVDELIEEEVIVLNKTKTYDESKSRAKPFT